MRTFRLTRLRPNLLFMAVMLISYQNCTSGSHSSNNNSSLNSNAGAITAQCTLAQSAPPKLSQTCFGSLSPRLESLPGSYSNFFEYEPQYPLYSDGATKRRWIFLPPGQSINTSAIDDWIFPKGTVLFKEFSISGIKIETRQLEKLTAGQGPNAWRFSNYAWTTDQTDAELVTATFYSSAQLSRFSASQVQAQFRIPSTSMCIACHDGAVDTVNGFNYLQLSSSATQFNLSQVIQGGFLSAPPTAPDFIHGSALDQKVVGYMQSNCVSCHSGIGPGTGNFRHKSTSQSLADEPLMITAASLSLIVKGQPDSSLLYIKFSTGVMPEIHPVTPDAKAIADMRSWIMSLQ